MSRILRFFAANTFLLALASLLLIAGSVQAATVLFPSGGGTGSSTLSGILRGNGTGAIKTLKIGSGLNFDGATLSTSGSVGGASTTILRDSNTFSGTTTLATTTLIALDKGGMVYNVKAYGAKGDGVTSDTNAVRAAVRAQQKNCDGYVFFPGGTYLMPAGASGASFVPEPQINGSEVDATCTLYLKGAGMYATTLQGNSNSPIISYVYNGAGFHKLAQVIAEDMTFDGNYVGVNGGVVSQQTPAGSAGEIIALGIPWEPANANQTSQGIFHIFNRVRFYRAAGFVFQPTTSDIEHSIFDSDGQPDIIYSGLHYDILGSGGTSAIASYNSYINSSGNYADFVSDDASAPPHLIFIGNQSTNHQIGGIYAAGSSTIIASNQLNNNYTGSYVGYDSGTISAVRANNQVYGNTFTNISIYSGGLSNPLYGDVEYGNIAQDSLGFNIQSFVGINTQTPRAYLHVNSPNGQYPIFSSDLNFANAQTGIEFRYANGLSTAGRIGSIEAQYLNGAGSTLSNALYFQTAYFGGVDTSLRSNMVINSNGNVGIGDSTSTPPALLTLTTPYFSMGSTTTLFSIASSTSGNSTTTLFSVSNIGSTTLGRFGACNGSNALTTNSSGTIICGAVSVGTSFPFTPQSYGNSTSSVITFTAGLISNGSTTIAGLSSGVVGDNNGKLYGFASSSLFGYTPLNPTRLINTTYPIQGGGNLSGDLTLSSAFGTTTANTFSQLQIFNGGLTTTGATSTSLAVTGSSTISSALNVGGNSFFGGNVGIGTASPGNNLTILNNGVGKQIRLGDIAGSQYQYEIGRDPTSNYLRMQGFQTNLDGYEWFTNQAVKMTFTNAGRLGIGTTTPFSIFHVTSGASATTTVTIGSIGLTSSKGCVNMNRSDGGAGSFYLNAAGVLVSEPNYCR